MSSYVKRAMQADERILFSAQLHWIIYKMGITTIFLGVLVAYFGMQVVNTILEGEAIKLGATPVRYIALGLIILGTFELLVSFIRQISTELVITDRRVIAKHGLVSTTSYELMMTKVEGATIEQSILGRVLGYGTLMVKGTGGGISPIDHVADPYRFHSSLMEALKETPESVSFTHNHVHNGVTGNSNSG